MRRTAFPSRTSSSTSNSTAHDQRSARMPQSPWKVAAWNTAGVTDDLDDLLAIARAVGDEAAALLAGARAARVASKSNQRDLVTEWDTRSEKLIRARLTAATPTIPIVGEEGGGEVASGRYWLVDPIDGTVNFAH